MSEATPIARWPKRNESMPFYICTAGRYAKCAGAWSRATFGPGAVAATQALTAFDFKRGRVRSPPLHAAVRGNSELFHHVGRGNLLIWLQLHRFFAGL